MHVIGHQAETENFHLVKRRILLQKPEVNFAIGTRKEDLAMCIAALRNMMGISRHNDTSETRHFPNSGFKASSLSEF